MDAANIDLKSFSERFYYRLTGAHLQPVLETLEYVKKYTNVWLEITTLLIPGENDTDAELHALAAWVVEHLGPDVPLHFTAFHPAWKMRDKPRTPFATLARARAIARQYGVRYAYIGNVQDEDGGSTYCHACGHPLIGRHGYALRAWHLTSAGTCTHCGAPCAGVFAPHPGDWGAKRLPVRFNSL